MVTIKIRRGQGYRWEEVQNGPFPITVEDWDKAVKKFQEFVESAKAKDKEGWNFGSCWASVAREILLDLFPKLNDFDRLMLGNPLAMVVIAGWVAKIEKVEG